MPIESVSKILGHTKLDTTRIYAQITDNKVSQDMEMVRAKMVG
jgi:site-specific recombinase XerD